MNDNSSRNGNYRPYYGSCGGGGGQPFRQVGRRGSYRGGDNLSSTESFRSGESSRDYSYDVYEYNNNSIVTSAADVGNRRTITTPAHLTELV